VIKPSLLLALLLALPAASQEIPEIPNRYQVSGYVASKKPVYDRKVFNATMTMAGLQRILLAPGESDRHKAQATEFWNAKMTEAYSRPRHEFWDAADNSFDLIEQSFDETAGTASSRRYAIFTIYANLLAQVRGSVIDAPDDKQYRTRWIRMRILAARGMRDKDVKLAEAFERFQKLRRHPDGAALKAQAAKAHQKIRAAHAGEAAKLDGIWELCLRLEKGQAEEQAVLSGQLKGQRRAPQLERKLMRYADEVFDYRMHTIWACEYPRLVEESLGKNAAVNYGLPPEPVRVGWPEV